MKLILISSMLYERCVAYLKQKGGVVTESALIKIAQKAGYSRAEITAVLPQLARHEFIVREQWDRELPTFAWVEDLVKRNRASYG